ncbi:DNase I-like protein [Mollisia scopiformis]|uniref:DNase I-like protein n=1 Tax=Mollisia scopiformis TaxID=149040 RepID=A0A194XPD8_MOLSC|nr:DNase I-like protein [Mollisia scopiformis]KUJ21602.1 DNase I-like protein [Mollisia scopiformis]
MSLKLENKKRPRTEIGSISPPPLRRKRHADASEEVVEHHQPKSKDDDAFQIFSWNVNSITHLLPKTQRSIKSFFAPPSPQGEGQDEDGGSKSVSLRDFLKRHRWPQYVGLQEVKISPKDEITKRTVEKAANGDEGPAYRAYFALPRDRYNATGWGGKVYGVCTLLRHDLASLSGQKTKEVDWDLEGRVLVTELPSLEMKLVIINGYWVNGTTNPYRSPETGQVFGTRHDRKRQFHSLMLEEVKSYQAKGWEVVLVGDMNIARTPLDGCPGIRLGLEHVKNRVDFNHKFFDDENGMHAIDSWRWIHGNKRGYSYHGEKAEDWGSSCDRVDLGMVTRGIVDRKALVGAEIYESVLDRGGSDHVPISLVLSTKVIMTALSTSVDVG